MGGGDNKVEEDDKILLNSLGVTSANPEDIERNILDKVRGDENRCQSGQHTAEEFQNNPKDVNPSSSKKDLYMKLKALEIEIDAVASSVEHTGNAAKIKESNPEDDGIKEDTRGKKGPNQDYTLHHALAADRLRSLKRTRSQLQKQLSDLHEDLSSGVGDDKLLEDLVREEPKVKRKLKTGQTSIKKQKKQRKVVTFDEDDGFDDVLNAASGGFIETERDELIRKGILTPFHKLKGFERRIQQTGPSSLPLEEETDHVSASVERAARSLAEAAQARPTTKFLETSEFPKLDAPTYPFQRLRAPFKLQKNPDNEKEKEKEKDKSAKSKKKRPLAGKKWRKRISREEQNVIGSK